jgi:hypothetical protein
MVATSVTFAVLSFNNGIVVGWHANLGISDEKAEQLYKSNPNDPEIIFWKNTISEIRHGMGYCFEPTVIDGKVQPLTHEAKVNCVTAAALIHDNCISHPGVLLACLDPRINQWAALVNSTSAKSCEGVSVNPNDDFWWNHCRSGVYEENDIPKYSDELKTSTGLTDQELYEKLGNYTR